MYSMKKHIKKIKDTIPVKSPAVLIPAITVSKDMGIPPEIISISSLDISSIIVASHPYMVGKHMAMARALRKPMNNVEGSSAASPSCHKIYLLNPFFRNLSIIRDMPKAKNISNMGSIAFVPSKVSIYFSEYNTKGTSPSKNHYGIENSKIRGKKKNFLYYHYCSI